MLDGKYTDRGRTAVVPLLAPACLACCNTTALAALSWMKDMSSSDGQPSTSTIVWHTNTTKVAKARAGTDEPGLRSGVNQPPHRRRGRRVRAQLPMYTGTQVFGLIVRVQK